MRALLPWERWRKARAARNGVPWEAYTPAQVYERGRGADGIVRCYLCNGQVGPRHGIDFHVEHVIDQGVHKGPDVLGNTMPAHISCNARKGTNIVALPASELSRAVFWSHAIGQRLARIGVRAVPLYPTPDAFGPATVMLRLWPAPGAVNALLRAAPEIEAVLGECRAGTPAIRFEAPYLTVTVPRMHPRAVALADMRSRGLRVQVGVTCANTPAIIDFGLDPHMLAAGITQYGKSTLLRNVALQVAHAGGRLALADGQRTTFERFRGCAALEWDIADTVADAIALAHAVCETMTTRAVGQNPPLFLMIDEVQMVMRDPAGRKVLRKLTQEGGKYNLHLACATQYVKDSELDTVLMSQCGIKASVRQGTAQGARNVGLPGAELLAGKGDALISQGGRMARAMVALPADSDYARLTMADGSTPHAPATAPHAPNVADDIAAWAKAQGPRVSARAIRLESQRRAPDGRGIGSEKATRIREMVRAGGMA